MRFGVFERHNLGIDAEFADASGHELGVLRAEVDDQNHERKTSFEQRAASRLAREWGRTLESHFMASQRYFQDLE